MEDGLDAETQRPSSSHTTTLNLLGPTGPSSHAHASAGADAAYRYLELRGPSTNRWPGRVSWTVEPRLERAENEQGTSRGWASLGVLDESWNESWNESWTHQRRRPAWKSLKRPPSASSPGPSPLLDLAPPNRAIISRQQATNYVRQQPALQPSTVYPAIQSLLFVHAVQPPSGLFLDVSPFAAQQHASPTVTPARARGNEPVVVCAAASCPRASLINLLITWQHSSSVKGAAKQPTANCSGLRRGRRPGPEPWPWRRRDVPSGGAAGVGLG
ncbi:hypothetical protein G7046_g6461 [Stylonectria norvegica]|nr:hypothetical protein G7046_g6461 [Stylonectria norvegica]